MLTAFETSLPKITPKVYVLGDQLWVVSRPSLPDSSEGLCEGSILRDYVRGAFYLFRVSFLY